MNKNDALPSYIIRQRNKEQNETKEPMSKRERIIGSSKKRLMRKSIKKGLTKKIPLTAQQVYELGLKAVSEPPMISEEGVLSGEGGDSCIMASNKRISKEVDKMINIVCIMATHGRPGITTETLKMLQSQTYPIQIYVVGDSEGDKKVANSVGCHYKHCENLPLGNKWQTVLNSAKELNPDAVMVCGSDSWLTPNWCEQAVPFINQGYDLIGINIFHACRAYPKQPVRIIKRGYRGARATIPMGSGRIYSRKILDRLKWNLFPVKANKHLDMHCYKCVISNKGKIKIMGEESKVLTIKSTWTSINSWEVYVKSKRNKIFPDIKEPRIWLPEHFPGSTESLEKVVRKLTW